MWLSAALKNTLAVRARQDREGPTHKCRRRKPASRPEHESVEGRFLLRGMKLPIARSNSDSRATKETHRWQPILTIDRGSPAKARFPRFGWRRSTSTTASLQP